MYSSAIKPSNPEIIAAYQNGVKLVHRSDILSLLLSAKRGVTVAGAHGKTTTSSLLAHILRVCGKGDLADPSYAIGGSIQAQDGGEIDGGHAGSGIVMVAEADESDGSFEKYNPYVAIVTNVEADHLDHYGNAQNYRSAFVEHLSHALGHIVICADDNGARAVLDALSDDSLKKTIVYASNKDNVSLLNDRVKSFVKFAFIEHESEKTGSGSESFVIEFNGDFIDVNLIIPGLHNARNACAAIIAAMLLGMSSKDAADGASSFRGASRRFDIRGCVNGVTVVDDYAHHPTEIDALGIFSARQKQEDFPDIHASTIVDVARKDDITSNIEAVEDMREGALKLANRAKNGDVLFTVGAGSITAMTSVMLEALSSKSL